MNGPSIHALLNVKKYCRAFHSLGASLRQNVVPGRPQMTWPEQKWTGGGNSRVTTCLLPVEPYSELRARMGLLSQGLISSSYQLRILQGPSLCSLTLAFWGQYKSHCLLVLNFLYFLLRMPQPFFQISEVVSENFVPLIHKDRFPSPHPTHTYTFFPPVMDDVKRQILCPQIICLQSWPIKREI